MDSQWPGYAGTPPGAWELIETYTADGSVDYFDFSSTLSSRWDEYEIVIDGFASSTSVPMYLRRNGSTDSGGHRTYLQAVNTSTTVVENSDSFLGAVGGNSVNGPAGAIVRILNPNATNPIVFSSVNKTYDLQNTTYVILSYCYLSAAITGLGIESSVGNFPSGMSFRLFGRRAA